MNQISKVHKKIAKGSVIRLKIINGETGVEAIRRAALAGAQSINFSVFGLAPRGLIKTQSKNLPLINNT